MTNAENMKRESYSKSERAFSELTENLEKADTALIKASLAADAYQLISSAAEIRECAAFIMSDLSELYSGKEGAEKITAFLNQAADYSKAAALLHCDGSSPSKEESETFLKLSEYAERLKSSVFRVKEAVLSGEMTLSEADEALPSFGDAVSEIETKEFSDYEGLSYSGRFSEHALSYIPSSVLSRPEIAKDDALKTALELLDGKILLTFSGETEGLIPAYIFSGDGENAHYSVQITKNGGLPLSVSSSRAYSDERLTLAECEKIAEAFASKAGFSKLTLLQSEENGSTATVSLVPEKDGVLFCPDTVKIQIAKDSGSIVSFSSYGYIKNNRERSLPEPSVSESEALSSLNEGFSYQNIRRVVTDSEYSKELYCYEISGTFADKELSIYINCETGRQEKITLRQ